MYAKLSCSGVSVAFSIRYLPSCLLLIVKVVVFQFCFAVQASLVTRQTCRRLPLLPVSQPAIGKKNNNLALRMNVGDCLCACVNSVCVLCVMNVPVPET